MPIEGFILNPPNMVTSFKNPFVEYLLLAHIQIILDLCPKHIHDQFDWLSDEPSVYTCVEFMDILISVTIYSLCMMPWPDQDVPTLYRIQSIRLTLSFTSYTWSLRDIKPSPIHSHVCLITVIKAFISFTCRINHRVLSWYLFTVVPNT